MKKKKSKVKINIAPELKRDIEDYSSLICQSCASQVRNKLRSEYQWAIQNFYASYEPEYYNRGFGLYNGYTPYYKNVRNKTFYGGIIITPDRMKDDYKDPKDYVLKGAMMGYHGTSAIQTASPLEYLLKIKDDIIKNPSSYIQKARTGIMLPRKLQSIFE